MVAERGWLSMTPAWTARCITSAAGQAGGEFQRADQNVSVRDLSAAAVAESVFGCSRREEAEAERRMSLRAPQPKGLP